MLVNNKMCVAQVEYEEYLPCGAITIGSKTYANQDFDEVLTSFGYDRSEYTYSFSVLRQNEEELTNTCMLYILKKYVD